MPIPSTPADPEVVLAILRQHEGRERAIKAKMVARLLEERHGRRLARGDRKVGLAVAELRERDDLDAVILSGDHGYWTAETPEECDECIGRLQAKAKSLLGIIRALERGRSRVFGESEQLGLGL